VTESALAPFPSALRTSAPPSLATPSMARVLAVGTAVPDRSYSQQDVLQLLQIDDPRTRSLFLNSAIERRHLILPPSSSTGPPALETQGELLAKHKAQAMALGSRAVQQCVAEAGARPADIRYLCCVTSTGFLVPGLSALLVEALDLDRHTARVDVVGMGCNAGLNGLAAADAWAQTHPGELAVMVCIEVCSAAYAFDNTMRTAVVNSLFGDGSAAVALVAGATGSFEEPEMAPVLVKFASHIIPEAMSAMRYDWDAVLDRFSFYLDPEVPYVVGAHAERTVDRLLMGTGLRRDDIGHWLVHSGGKKVIDSVMVNLGLTPHQLRNTTGVLRDYGNVSSGSFLFSYDRLASERVVCPGDYGVLMTMGPGATIESALIRW
jgi:polyketide synthase Type III